MAAKRNGAGGEVTKPKRVRNARGAIEESLTRGGYVKGEDGIWSKPGEPGGVEIETPDEELEIPGFDAKHLTGQLTDFLVEQVKHGHRMKAWDQRDEADQRRMIDYCQRTAKGLVIAAAQSIAGKGFQSAPMVLDQATLKDGVKITLSCGNMEDAAFLALKNNQGRLVQLVFADAEDFAGEPLSKPSPNQPDMLADDPGDEEEDDPENEDDADEIDPETDEIKPATPPAGDPPEQPAAQQ